MCKYCVLHWMSFQAFERMPLIVYSDPYSAIIAYFHKTNGFAELLVSSQSFAIFQSPQQIHLSLPPIPT